MTSAGSAVYHDFQSLSALRFEANTNPSAAIDEVATQFESLFMQMMLKSMRDATVEGGLFESDQMEHYQSMFDQQISLNLASQGALGLSDILVTQLGGDKPDAEPANTLQPPVTFSGVAVDVKRQVMNLYSTIHQGLETAKNIVSETTELYGANTEERWQPASPEEFIRGVWESAVTAAKTLGLAPEVLVAQSALETGWGKQLIPAADGTSSFNLFGIKSGGAWSGESAVVNTLEFRDGVAVKEKASFRIYDSVAGSFDDYVDFLKSNPRYQQALENVDDSRQFLLELQDAGYATDPQYADKIMDIVGRNTYGSVINELKNLQGLPLSS